MGLTSAIKNKIAKMNKAAQDAELQKRISLYSIEQTVQFSQFTDGGSTSGTFKLTAGSVPAGATFLRSSITNVVGFTGDTSAVITIGDGTDVDRYNTGTPSVFTTSTYGVDAGAPSGTLYHTAAKDITLTVTSATDFGAIAAGSVTVKLYWLE